MESKYLTQEELGKIQDANTTFNKAKMALGGLEMEKNEVLKQIDALKKEFAEHELELVKKYGANAVINMQTGEVTQKQNDLHVA
jgi:hypothetical protein